MAMRPLYGPGLTGLGNIGNSCYISSVLQCVCAIAEFQQRYYSGEIVTPRPSLLAHLKESHIHSFLTRSHSSSFHIRS